MLAVGTNGWDFADAVLATFVALLPVIGVGWLRLRQTDRKAADAKKHAAEAKATGEQVQAAVGFPNGNGNVSEMTERLLSGMVELLRWKDETQRANEMHELRRREFIERLQTTYDGLVLRINAVEEQLKGT